MKGQITKEELKENPLFWYNYICWFRGFDDKKEMNIDEALEVLEINQAEFDQWHDAFFPENPANDDLRYIEECLCAEMTIHIEFRAHEIVFFLNDRYIGNLGGHFEAWFLTWEELLAFDRYDFIFLLLLPMAGIEQDQVNEAEKHIAHRLRSIPQFEHHAEYIAYCIVNGLKIEGKFSERNDVGIVNNQNHSVRNIEKYPDYTEDVISLNATLKRYAEGI